MTLLLDEIDEEQLSNAVKAVLTQPAPSRAELGPALGVRRLNDLWSDFEGAAQELVTGVGRRGARDGRGWRLP
jgi:hypothetical protein